MGRKLDQLVLSIRQEKGPFFMARLCLRVDFDLSPGATADSDEKEKQLVDACRGLGYLVNRERVARPPTK
jgi:hypothetical protein